LLYAGKSLELKVIKNKLLVLDNQQVSQNFDYFKLWFIGFAEGSFIISQGKSRFQIHFNIADIKPLGLFRTQL
jgi:hypothetical protein